MANMGEEGEARREVVRMEGWSILKPRRVVYQVTAAAQSGTETATWLSIWLKGLGGEDWEGGLVGEVSWEGDDGVGAYGTHG